MKEGQLAITQFLSQDVLIFPQIPEEEAYLRIFVYFINISASLISLAKTIEIYMPRR